MPPTVFNAAVRTVSEDDQHRTIEGLAYPFRGRDTYGTFFSARTNYHWPLFVDVDPTATRADAEPAFVRPMTFHHGFDTDFGLDLDGVRVGGWSPVRMDADGVWVRAQIEKRHAYYESRLKPLLDSNALGLSGGSAEHSVRIDQRTGEVLDWPAYELALTPVESNPLAQLATRAGETITILSARNDRPAPGTRAWSPAADDAAMGAGVLGTLLYLIGRESDEADQVAQLQTAADALTEWITAERAEIVPEAADDGDDELVAAMSGIRADYVNRLHAAAALPIPQAAPSDGEDAVRSSGDAEVEPTVSVVTADADPLEAIRADIATRAAAVAAEVVASRTG